MPSLLPQEIHSCLLLVLNCNCKRSFAFIIDCINVSSIITQQFQKSDVPEFSSHMQSSIGFSIASQSGICSKAQSAWLQ